MEAHSFSSGTKNQGLSCSALGSLKKKVEPKWLHPGAVLENGATLEGGAIIFLTVPKWGPSSGHENGSTVEPFRLHFFLSVLERAFITHRLHRRISQEYINNYRPRTNGDNALGSVRLSVHLSVCLFALSRLNRLTYDLRGSALPSAAKSNRSHYQFKMFVCVSLISRRMRIMRGCGRSAF